MRFLLSLLVLLTTTGFALAQTAFDLPAREAYLIDATTNTVLFTKNAQEKMPPASMSKLMTAYVVFDTLKKGKLKLSDELPVSERAWAMQGSKMFVDINTKVKVEDLLRGMIIQSGNDACIVLAEGIAGSEESFANLMNDYAKKIGLTGSHFMNSTGWPHPEHHMTAHDLAVLGLRLMTDFPEYTHYYKELDFTYHNIKQGNRNPLLYGFPGAEGLKTGHTTEAGYGLTASVMRDGRRLIGVINGLESMQARADEAKRLMTWGFGEFRLYPIAKSGQTIATLPVWGGLQAQVAVHVKQDIARTLPNRAQQDITTKIRFTSPLQAPVTTDQPIAQLVISGVDGADAVYPLYAAEPVAAQGFFARAWRGLRYLLTGK